MMTGEVVDHVIVPENENISHAGEPFHTLLSGRLNTRFKKPDKSEKIAYERFLV